MKSGIIQYKYDTVQYSTVQYRYDMIRYSTMRYNKYILYYARYSTVEYIWYNKVHGLFHNHCDFSNVILSPKKEELYCQ